jgi:RNA polymerase sigma-70 factor (ECF subfamily)
VDDLGTRLYRLALRVTGVKEDAEAAIDEVLSAAEVTSPTASDEPPLAWLSRSVARAAHARLRRRRADRHPQPQLGLDDVMPPLDGDGLHFEPMEDWSGRVGDPARHPGFRAVLTEAIDGLPADSRTALILHDTEGMATRDIADVLDIDPPAVSLHVHRARLFLRKRLSDHFEATDAA